MLAVEPAVVAESAVEESAEVAVAEAEVAVADSANRQVRSQAGWIRATRSHHHRNPRPASAARARTIRQEVLPVGCSPQINACPPRRFRILTGARMSDETLYLRVFVSGARGRAPQWSV